MNRPRFRTRAGRRGNGGFTLIELMVVVVIVLLISAVVLPTVVSALNNRQVSEAARILQAALAGARDAAIRANAPRGIRLIPDSILFTAPAFNNGTLVSPGALTYSRMVPIEPADNYSEGKVQIVGDGAINLAGGETYYYSLYPTILTPRPTYPPFSLTVPPSTLGRVLRVEEAAFDVSSGVLLPNNPTSWWWNIRVGDKIRIGESGRYYTVVGPLTVNPNNPLNGVTNPELFVNDGLPGNARTSSGLQRTYTTPTGSASTTVGIEFLYVVNGQDDDGDGYVDNGWDGLDNDFQNGVDDAHPNAIVSSIPRFGEWENEVWVGALEKYNDQTKFTGTIVPVSGVKVYTSLDYEIARRPVASRGARDTVLPGSVVIDATTWNSTQERSRLPIDPFSFTVDILLDQTGKVIPTTVYSSPASFPMTESFYHFWLADRADVFNPGTFLTYPTLPVPPGFQAMVPTGAAYNLALTTTPLQKDRMLLTLYARTGQIVTNTIENFSTNGTTLDVNAPYTAAQLGIREAK
jgi:prepilin-type N-terminal cleavage/methylation domain-containing protein